MFCLNTRLRSFQEEWFEALMPEFLDHIASVTWNDSGNKEPHDWEAQNNYIALVIRESSSSTTERRHPSCYDQYSQGVGILSDSTTRSC